MFKALIISLISLSAFAEPLPNINGMVGRLELMVCDGANVVKAANVTALYEQVEEACKLAPNMDTCFEKYVKTNTPFVSSRFTGKSIPETKQFNMTINATPTGALLFSSLREGFHADASDNGIVLMFKRAGVPNDDYMIETGRLASNGASVPSLLVPVKRRLLADQIYFFFNCTLRWVH